MDSRTLIRTTGNNVSENGIAEGSGFSKIDDMFRKRIKIRIACDAVIFLGLLPMSFDRRNFFELHPTVLDSSRARQLSALSLAV